MLEIGHLMKNVTVAIIQEGVSTLNIGILRLQVDGSGGHSGSKLKSWGSFWVQVERLGVILVAS